MNYLKKVLTLFLAVILFLCQGENLKAQKTLPKLLVRVDDIGMNHSVNTAVKDLAEAGIPFSTSVMFACPWYQEAVEILKQHPHVSVGVHLTLNAEWKNYRWGPVLGRSAVPSLVDKHGYFLPSVKEFHESKYKLEEVEMELEAQILRALDSGVKIDYVDYHMGMAVSTPELRAIVEKLAKKYQLGISKYFGEEYTSMWAVPVQEKKQRFLKYLQELKTDKINLVEFHIAHKTPEMDVLVDMNSSLMASSDGKPMASDHRQTELNVLLSKEFRDQIGKKFSMITYGELLKTVGVEKMMTDR
jgi:chitin disaccharide deacetylase